MDGLFIESLFIEHVSSIGVELNRDLDLCKRA
jgi:hypothetical protein